MQRTLMSMAYTDRTDTGSLTTTAVPGRDEPWQSFGPAGLAFEDTTDDTLTTLKVTLSATTGLDNQSWTF
jgi:hypothetical protein